MSIRRLGDPGERTNGIVGWVLLGVVLFAAVESFVTGSPLWGGFALVFFAIAALPAATTRDWTVLVPWPLLFVGAAAMTARAVGFDVAITAYVAVAVLALVGVAELDTYTDVEMSRRFAIVFAALTTMAVQGLWTIVQYYSDQWLGTEYIQGQADIQWGFVFVTIVAIVVSGVFELYFARTDDPGTDREPTVE